MLHLLEALQLLQIKVPGGGPAEARRLSFRALDIEQIGHVYEGLLDHTAKRAKEPFLGLAGTRDKEPEIPLAALEKVAGDGWSVEGEAPKPNAALLKFLKEQTGRSESALKKGLTSPATHPDPLATQRLRTACQSNDALLKRIESFSGLLRMDNFGYPVVIQAGSIFVTAGTDRRSSGTHYTPRILTEPIVQHTLEPLVYIGPAEGLPRGEWKLKSARELLELKICDMACGSGAFLVQACRYLAARLLESWHELLQNQPGTLRMTPEGQPATGNPGEFLIPDDPDERLLCALRLVAQRCLYGVDINPLAVEMAKLSLWLLTMARDKPFEFLDHNIRCGDSLVGLHSLDQLRHYSLKPDADDAVLFKGPLDNAVDEAIALRLKLEDMPSNTIEDVQRQEKLLIEANEKMARLRCAADLLVSAEFWGENAKDKLERVRHAAVRSGHYIEHGPTEEFEQIATKERRGQKMFHWPLEFPEVMVTRNGFDAFVGNPPFMGGLKLYSQFGRPYRSFLIERLGNGVTGVRGTADLCAYFFLRVAMNLRQNGGSGLLATNTIAQGDTREVGLDQVMANGAIIYRATKSQRWPGVASLEVARVHFRLGSWLGTVILDEHSAHQISATLNPASSGLGKPNSLVENANKAFIGSYVTGLGFCLSPFEANSLIARSPINKKVLFPYLDGDDLNTSFNQSARRWIINFFDWPFSNNGPSQQDTASDYPECLAIVESKVKPERVALPPINHFNKGAAERWWQYGGPRHALYKALAKVKRTLATARVSPTNAVVWLPVDVVFHEKVVCFPEEDDAFFGIMQSTFHWEWAREYTSTLGATTLNYSPAACFMTFPFPIFTDRLRAISSDYDQCRKRIMNTHQEGLTKTYNQFNNSANSSADIQNLRNLHVEMDQAVAAAYGWKDLDLGHGFHETKQGVRFTISEPARREVLQRLLKLNHERYAEEVKQGLHEKKKGGGGRVKGGAKKKAKVIAKPEPSLFQDDEDNA